MLSFPAQLTPEAFLSDYWQKQPLFLLQATDGPTPSISRNELAWLATLDDVESRIVFVDRDDEKTRYRAETGPFDESFLNDLPKRDWTLLVHDVEKHLPEIRALFRYVPFIPDWRIDDLMVSFAAPGGGVGPHKDNYDVFLCQGIGRRRWMFTTEDVPADPAASDDLALQDEFNGECHDTVAGDVLYLPPGVAHHGVATRACMTYSIGMRAPQLSDLAAALPDEECANPFYEDPDLLIDEAIPGFITNTAIGRACDLLGESLSGHDQVAETLGRFVTETKGWLKPEGASTAEAESALDHLADGGKLPVHGMARIAWDDRRVYVNGASVTRPAASADVLASLCANRTIERAPPRDTAAADLIAWMLRHGAFEIPEVF